MIFFKKIIDFLLIYFFNLLYLQIVKRKFIN